MKSDLLNVWAEAQEPRGLRRLGRSMEPEIDIGAAALQQDVLLEGAVYARFSDIDRQRESSIDSQVGECREGARRRRYEIPDRNIFADPDVRGAVTNRPGLNKLLDLIRSGKATFSALFVADSSRLTRNTAFAPRLRKFFEFHRIKLFFVENGMESGSSGFAIQHQIISAFDEHYSVQLADKVKRGQVDATQRGQRASGHCYGYCPNPIEHPSRMGMYGRPEVIGVDDVIDPEKAAVVVSIFNMYANGFGGYLKIARELNSQGIRPPGTPLQNPVSCWNHAAVRIILHNERYIGRILYNRTETVRDPDTEQVQHRKRDKSEWIIVEKPSLRIIPQELWDRAHSQMAYKRDEVGWGKSGGLAPKAPGRVYLFSGHLKCGVCGGSLILKNTGGPYSAYYCSNRLRGGGCTNKQKVRLRSLEQTLVQKIVDSARSVVTFGKLKSMFMNELAHEVERREAMAEGAGTRLHNLQKELSDLTRGLENLAEEIADHGGNDYLRDSMHRKGVRLDTVKKEIAKLQAPAYTVKEEEIEAFLHSELDHLSESLLGDPLEVKMELQRRVGSLSLTPVEFDGRPAVKITGDLTLFTDQPSFLLESTVDSTSKQEYNRLRLDQVVLLLDEVGDVIGTREVSDSGHIEEEEPLKAA